MLSSSESSESSESSSSSLSEESESEPDSYNSQLKPILITTANTYSCLSVHSSLCGLSLGRGGLLLAVGRIVAVALLGGGGGLGIIRIRIR